MKSKKNQGKLDRLFSKRKQEPAREEGPKPTEKARKQDQPQLKKEAGKALTLPPKTPEAPQKPAKISQEKPDEIKKSEGTQKSAEILELLRTAKEEQKEVFLDAKDLDILTFSLSEEWYAIEIGYVESIIRVQKITEVPGLPNYIMGVTNLRGEVISVVDIRLFLNLERPASHTEPAILIIKYGNVTTGFYVDAVGDVANISTRAIDPPLSTIGKIQAEFLLGETMLDGQFLAIINLKNLMVSDKMKV